LALTLQALCAGKHVIVEKPPFLHARDFAVIHQAQAETGRRVFVAENYFYKPVAVKLRKLIGAGWIGDVLFVHVNALKKQTTANWRDAAELSGGGALFEGGIHWINFIANLGLEVKSVRGLRPGAPSGLEKSMLVAVEYANGAVGSLYYSWEIPVMLQGLHLSQIYGRQGVITFESNGLFIFVNGRKKRLLIPGVADIAGYRGMFQDFLHALRTGEEPQMNLARAQKDLELIEAIYQSSIQNRQNDFGQNY
jgi:predicted dehydrogenase